jgi:hypothetical protein
MEIFESLTNVNVQFCEQFEGGSVVRRQKTESEGNDAAHFDKE